MCLGRRCRPRVLSRENNPSFDVCRWFCICVIVVVCRILYDTFRSGVVWCLLIIRLLLKRSFVVFVLFIVVHLLLFRAVYVRVCSFIRLIESFRLNEPTLLFSVLFSVLVQVLI